MTHKVIVNVKKAESPFLNIIESVDAEIVNVPKFLEAYPFLARFPTRQVGSGLTVPAICEIAKFGKSYSSQILRSWFVNFSARTVNGSQVRDSYSNDLMMEILRHLGCGDVISFRVDPNEDDFHLIRFVNIKDFGKIHVLVGADRSNGTILKATIVRFINED